MDDAAELSHTVQINAPPARVWRVLADLEAVQYYNTSVLKANCSSPQREGVGARRECTVKEGVLEEKVIGWEAGRSVEMELVESPWPIVFMRWKTDVAARDGGTLVSQKVHYKLKFAILGSLFNARVMRKKMDKQLSEILPIAKRMSNATCKPVRTPEGEPEMPSPDERYSSIVERMQGLPKVDGGKMFGSAGLRVNGKVFAMLVKGALVEKFSAERCNALVESGGGQLFDPGHGRLMKEWVQTTHGPRTSAVKAAGATAAMARAARPC